MITLRNWFRRATWYCLFALIVDFLLALSLLYFPPGAFVQRILSTTFSIVLLVIAVVILVQAIDGVGLLFEAGAREEGPKRIIMFLAGVVLMLVCGALAWLLILRLHQSFGDFLRGSDAVLMQVEILGVGALVWREVRRTRIQQQKKP